MYGFEKRSTAEKLKKLVEPSAETYKEKVGYTTQGAPQIRAYVAQPVTDIPGAIRIKCDDSDGHVYYRPLLGKGLVYIHERDVDGSVPADYTKVRRYPTISDPQRRVEPYIRTAYNLCPETIIADGDGQSLGCPDTMLFCVEDIKGDLYIVKVCQWDCFSSSSSFSSGGSSSSGESSGAEGSSSSEGSSGSEASSGTESESGGSESASGFCRESADVPFVSSINFSGGVISWETGIMHFRNGHFCGYETDGGGEGSGDDSQGGKDGRRINRIDLCNLECPSSSGSNPVESSGSENSSGKGSREENDSEGESAGSWNQTDSEGESAGSWNQTDSAEESAGSWEEENSWTSEEGS